MVASWELRADDLAARAARRRGALVVGVDGVDGAGKTTLVAFLIDHFRSQFSVAATKPFGSPDDEPAEPIAAGLTVGQVLYDFALNDRYGFDDVESQLAFTISIRRHERAVLERLRSCHDLVVTDRSSLSAAAYARVSDPNLAELVAWAVQPLAQEDAVLWLDVDPSVAFGRRTPKAFVGGASGSDIVLKKGLDYQRRAAREFGKLADEDLRVVQLDAAASAATVAADATVILNQLLAR